nr:MAG TPA: hypothetical protein [Caudoviricetes sp.]
MPNSIISSVLYPRSKLKCAPGKTGRKFTCSLTND